MLLAIKRAALLSAALLASSLSFAAVNTPNVHLGANTQDLGLSIEQEQLSIEGLVLSISPLNSNGQPSLLNDTHFSLNASYAGDWFEQGYRLGQRYNQGLLNVYQNQTLLLSASFDELQLYGQAQQNQGQIFADLDYLDGIWAQGLNGGRLEASFQQSDALGDLSAIDNARFVGTLGPVSAVPIPGAAFLFLSAAAIMGFRIKRR